MPRKATLSKEKIKKKALKILQKSSLEGVTMRKLSAALRVEAMSLYNYYPSKEVLLDDLVDHVFESIDWQPEFGQPWKAQIYDRCCQLRKALLDHPWALGLLESRKNPGFQTLLHHNNVIGCFVESGMSIDNAGHAYALIDSYVYGFVLQELTLAKEADHDINQVAESMLEDFPQDQLPYLYEFTVHKVVGKNYNFGDEFEVGLNLVLNSLKDKQGER